MWCWRFHSQVAWFQIRLNWSGKRRQTVSLTFMPGYDAGSTHIHHLHAYAALVAAVVLFGIGWFAGRRA